MQQIDKQISKFIKKHHVFTLATCKNNNPWCASCFYAWDDELAVFVYSADLETRHGIEANENQYVSANILLETQIVGRIMGLQISGQVLLVDTAQQNKIRAVYLKRFPYAIAVKLQLWVLKPTFMKLTNNKLGFGKKLIWHS